LCSAEVVALTPKAFAVLHRLVEDGGQLVSKEELLRCPARGPGSAAHRGSRLQYKK
jgi:DNA-binding response OmpR family regulator